jgi:hypothetical protein
LAAVGKAVLVLQQQLLLPLLLLRGEPVGAECAAVDAAWSPSSTVAATVATAAATC